MVGSKSKYITICVSLILIMTLSACDKYVNTHSSSQTQGQAILKCFEKKDKKTLKSIFSEKIRKRKEFDSEIDTALNFIDGKIVSYDPDTDGGSGDSIDDGKINYIRFYPHISDIKTDKEKKYSISGLYYVENGIEPDNIGLVALTIFDTTNTKNFDHTNDPQVIVGDYGEY